MIDLDEHLNSLPHKDRDWWYGYVWKRIDRWNTCYLWVDNSEEYLVLTKRLCDFSFDAVIKKHDDLSFSHRQYDKARKIKRNIEKLTYYYGGNL